MDMMKVYYKKEQNDGKFQTYRKMLTGTETCRSTQYMSETVKYLERQTEYQDCMKFINEHDYEDGLKPSPTDNGKCRHCLQTTNKSTNIVECTADTRSNSVAPSADNYLFYKEKQNKLETITTNRRGAYNMRFTNIGKPIKVS
jgi:hypothetical protein